VYCIILSRNVTAEDCGDLNDPVNGKVEMSGTAFWDTATYTCNNGFEIVGNAIRTCEETGKWSGVAPFCRSVSCGFLNSPDNGRVTFTGVVLNSVATYDCFQGYEIVGQTERICQYDGQWSGREPHCQAVSCGPLTDPENGKVMLKGTEVFEIATYTCNEGFGLIGVSSRICQASGSWSDDAPTCEPSDCGQLSSPLNGMVKTTGTKYWDTAAYSCMPGYHLNGKDTRTCLETGSWSDEEPYCEAVDCRDLVPLEYGEVSFTSTKFRARASYLCNDGFQLIGDSTRMCEADGSWSGHAPFCQSVFCFEIFPPENGELHLSKGNSPGSIATYSCNVGYQLLGNEERHCKNDGHWSGSDPFCQSAGCGSLADILNGQISLSKGASFGSIATYTCDSGYELVGKSTRECSTGGRWSGTRPICKSVNCGQLSFPGFGQVALTGTTPGSTATYSCNSGYQLVGDAVRTCQNNGQWTGREPTCDALDCGTLEDPTNGAVNIRDTAAGSVALYECNPGYILAGKPQRVCLPYSQWSGSAPTCNAVDCGPLSPPPNGDIRVSVTTFGSFARYSCSIGYELTGLEVRVCQTDGTWSGSAPICKISECPALAKPANGRVTLTGRTFGSKATYSCNRGYELIGGSMRECTSNHVWSGKEPICKPVSCGSLTHPDNGRVEYSDSIVGSVAVYYCDNSYAINGLRTRACQSNGQWTGQTPTCDPIKAISTCDDLPDPPNGHVIISGSNSGDTATYTCFVGYNVVGVDIRYCRDDGTWTGTEPRCRPVDCGQLDVPRYGEIRYINSGFGAIARYTCLPGYELVGDYSRTCKSDGYWSGESPHCIPDSSATPPPPPLGCGDPGTPANGVKIGISYSIGSVVYYECNEGFRLDGPRSRLCRFDGRWSEQLPSCIGNGQCVGNAKVVDQCGQQCTCENGRLINCCRLRQDFTSLTSAEKKRYINAVVTVIEEPQYRGTYTKLLNEYKKSFGTLAQDTSPDTSQFFVWNRYFLIEFENLLREVDCSITIPYYDWTNLHANPYIHPIWADEEGFGKSYRQSDNCVSSGPFRYDEYSLISSAGGGCLKREYSNKKFPSRAFIERDVLTRPASEFSIFQRSLQLFVHTNVRCFIGGTMCTKDAANDPIFILHLAQIDFIYNRWQSFDEERLKVRYANDNTDLALAEGLLVSQFHDNSNLPNGVAVCYKKPSYKSHVPASLQFLAQSFSGSTNNDRIYVTCVSEDKFSQSGLTITAEDKEIINEKCKH
jgi:CUB/sushi domain-containing protein